jgi:hypothetical protein
MSDDQQQMMTLQQEATAIHAVPAQCLDCGFRLLILRELHAEKKPPAFGWIEQRLLRTPQRLSLHGLFFASTFLPEIVDWLSEHLGRPSVRTSTGEPFRNSRWPIMTWHSEDRIWPGGIHTIEWFVDIIFQDKSSWAAFQQHWHDRLMGKIEESGVSLR